MYFNFCIYKKLLYHSIKEFCLTWQRPTLPGCDHPSTIGAEELNFRVRDGNGCTLFAIVTGSPAHTGGSLDRVYITTFAQSCQRLFRRIFGPFKNLLKIAFTSFITSTTNDHRPQELLQASRRGGVKYYPLP